MPELREFHGIRAFNFNGLLCLKMAEFQLEITCKL